MTEGTNITRVEQIEHCIFLARGQKVMLDFHLAALYGVETKNLNKAVRRNQDRFPADFVFHLTAGEIANSRWPAETLLRVHRAGSRHAFQHVAERTRHTCQCRH